MKVSEIECLQVWELPFFCSNSCPKLNFPSLKLLWETHILSPSSQFLAFSLQSTEFAYLGTPCHDTVSKLPLPGHWFWPDFVWFLPRFLGQLEFWAKEPLGFHWEWIEKHNFEQKNLWDFTEIAGKNRIHTWRISFFGKFTFWKSQLLAKFTFSNSHSLVNSHFENFNYW